MARIFIGVAWPYSNGPFHIGHLAGAYLPADIFARYHRLKGDEVLMASGSDMHGTPTLVTAEKEGSTPEAIARRFHQVNADAFRRLGMTYDVFTHTHTALHRRVVQELFLQLLQNGYILRRTEENAYCARHQRFLPDRYLVGTCPHCGYPKARGDECDNCGRVVEPKTLIDPKCSIDSGPIEFRPSEHFYLDLAKLQPKLDEFLANKSHWRMNVTGVARNFLNEGLHPTAITRDLEWGVPIPLEGYDSKRFYVWFDAVTGYLSASKEWAIRSGRPSAWTRFWSPDEPVRQYYFVGKDNIFHHTIVWPAMLLGHGGLAVPYDVPANEWMLIGGGKISKSRTRGAEPFIPYLLERYAPDLIRFYAAVLAPQNHDTEYDPAEFDRITEEVLSNQYGNLVQRALVLVRDRYSGKVPDPPEGWSHEADAGLPARIRNAHRKISQEYEAVHLKEALDSALVEVREANRAFQEARPWDSPEADRRRALYEALWLLKAAAVWMAPVLPFSSAEVFRILGYAEAPKAGDWDHALQPVPAGQILGEVRPLFPRADSGTESAPTVPPRVGPVAEKKRIPLEIRAARVKDVRPHPSADRLYVLSLELGPGEERTVVAGMRPYYTVDQLSGRMVAVLTNLQPRTIRKVTSEGMVLAAEAGDRVALLRIPEGVAPGDRIGPSGAPVGPISIDEFAGTPIVVGHVRANVDDGRLRLDVGNGELTVNGRAAVGSAVVVRLSDGAGSSAEVLGFGSDRPLLADESLPSGSRIR